MIRPELIPWTDQFIIISPADLGEIDKGIRNDALKGIPLHLRTKRVYLAS